LPNTNHVKLDGLKPIITPNHCAKPLRQVIIQLPPPILAGMSSSSLLLPTLERLEAWLAAHLPATLADLNPPASSVDVADLEAECGFILPADLHTLYGWHDGQRGSSSGLFYGLQFLSLENIAQEWNTTYELLMEDEDFGDGPSSSTPAGAIQGFSAHVAWIPLAHDGSGNFLGLDLDPDSAGVAGQVINFGADESNHRVLAPSLGAFLLWLVEQLESGNFQLDAAGDAVAFNTKDPANHHFFDGLPLLFP
jgi:cell wall assembly regulator SMI1